jgi:hypothetical protein
MQGIKAQSYFSFSADALKETKWRYTYTLHSESDMVLHKTDHNYHFFLYFKFDNTYQQLLNGTLTSGIWLLSDNKLSYAFQGISNFKIIVLSATDLVLEFERSNSKGHFQYHFVNTDEDNPFPKPSNELPMVRVKAKRTLELPWWVRNFQKNKPKDALAANAPRINIELVGGGFTGAIDPILRDYIAIKNDGRLIQEYQTKAKGLMVKKKNIPREELERFCEYVVAQKFFEYQREYDCHDQACETRKRYKPSPIPLRLSISYGDKKKVVSVSIWGMDERHLRYVDYPPALDNIIDAIQRFAHREER